MIVLDAAHDYVKHGWSVVPLHGIDADHQCRCGRGSLCPPKTRGKHPSLGNAWQKNTLASGADVQAWFEDHPRDNIGIATGADSGLWVLDIDGSEGINTLTSLTAEHGPLPMTRIIRTGSGGLHYYWRHPAEFEPRNSTSWIGPGIDVRGRGGQVVAPPSTSGRGGYEVIAAHPVAEAPTWLLSIVADHATMSAAGATAEVKGAERVDVEFIPAKVLELAGTLVEADAGRFRHFYAIVAACFEHGYTQGQAVTIVAPWCVAVGKFVGRIEAEVARSWGKLEVEAAKANDWVDGIAGPGSIKTPAPAQPASTQPSPTPPVDGTTALAIQPSTDTSDDDPTLDLFDPTWRPVDLEPILTGTYVPEIPSLLPRTDGHSLLYPGRVHSLHGESESGKSLVAQAECARLVKTGAAVLYIDFESDAPAVANRLLEMECTPDQIRSAFTYLRPDNDPRKFAHEREELAAVLRADHTLIIIDGVTDALGIFGAGSTDNDEIAAFMRSFPRMLARKTGAAVVLIDHVTKDADSRGRYALGGQAKMNALDGSAFVVEVTEPLGRGMRGSVTLRVAKDRPGGVRPHAGAFRKTDRTQEAARVVVDSTSGSIIVTVEAPANAGHTASGSADQWRPTNAMLKVSRFLERAVTPVSLRNLRDGVDAKAETVDKAVALLEASGYVKVEDGPRRARLHSSIKAYDPDQDPLSETYIGWVDEAQNATVSDRVSPRPGRGADDRVPSPPSLRGGTQSAVDSDSAENADRVPTSTDLSYLACNRCGEEYLAEVIEAGRGVCPECVR